MKRRTLGILILLMAANVIMAQSIVSKPIPFSYDLSSHEIWVFSQDNDGYIWAATTNGIARYDGYKTIIFRNDYRHPSLLAANNVLSVTDGGEYIWIGTPSGLTLFDKNQRTFHSPADKALKTAYIKQIVVCNTEVWINGNDGMLFRCSSNGHLEKTYRITSNADPHTPAIVNDIYSDRNGTLWAVVGRSALTRYDAVKDCFISIPETAGIDPLTMYQDKSGRYWVGSWGTGLYEYIPKEKGEPCLKKISVINKLSEEEYPCIFSIVQDDAMGYLWALTFNSLYVFEMLEDGTLRQVDISPYVQMRKMYTRITKDREGNIWLSSYDTAYIISFDNSNVANYPLTQFCQQEGWDTNILDICVDDEGQLWLNQDRLGPCFYDTRANRLLYIHPTNKGINCRLSPSHTHGSTWINDYNSPVANKFCHRGEAFYIEETADLTIVDNMSGNIIQMEEDSEGCLWLLTDMGRLFAYHNKQIFPLYEDKLQGKTLISDKTGTMWCLSSGGTIGKLYFDGTAKEEIVTRGILPTTDSTVVTACIDGQQQLWLISSMGVVYKSNTGKKQLAKVDFNHLFDDCMPLKILSEHDNLWIVTNKKIVKYRPQEQAYVVYSVNDENICVSSFLRQASALDGKGGLYAGGHDGIVHIQAEDKGKEWHWKHEPAVTDVTVDGQSLFFNGKEGEGQQVTLSPDARNIEIFLSLMKYSIGQQPRLAYMLDGADRDWHYLSPEKHSALYSRLDDGKYAFLVKYEYEPGQWSEPRTLLTVVQLPAWYDTWWAYLIYIILFVGLCYLILITPLTIGKLRRNLEEMKMRRNHHNAIMGKISDPIVMEDDDEQLLNRIIADIEAHMADSDYGVNELSDAINMSKSTLNRKLKQMTDMSPYEFILSVRMKRACQLLIHNRISVAEVAYATGFTNPKYFAKVFKEFHKCTPSEYRQQNQEESQGDSFAS